MKGVEGAPTRRVGRGVSRELGKAGKVRGFDEGVDYIVLECIHDEWEELYAC